MGRVEKKGVWKGVTKEDYKSKAWKESSKSHKKKKKLKGFQLGTTESIMVQSKWRKWIVLWIKIDNIWKELKE